MLRVLVVVAVLVAAFELGPLLVGCGIKGNISYNTGERIYHVHGQEYYWATRMNLFKGSDGLAPRKPRVPQAGEGRCGEATEWITSAITVGCAS